MARRPEYLWRPWLPKACYIDLAGDPGAGKTFLAVEIAACATRGLWPDGTHTAPAQVVFMATEDALETVLKPRLVAAKADEDFYHCIEGVPAPDGGLNDVSLDRDLPAILTYLAELRADLLYIDALVDVLATHDGKGYVESRHAMRAVSHLASLGKVVWPCSPPGT
jgi:hypothetical protein